MRMIQVLPSGGIVPLMYTNSLRQEVLTVLTVLADQFKETGVPTRCPIEALELIGPELTFVRLGTGWMAVSTNMPWYSTEHVLCEEFIGPGVSVEQAVEALEAICKATGVHRYEVGTRAAPRQKHQAVAQLYQRQGLRLSTISLEGVVDNEQEVIA